MDLQATPEPADVVWTPAGKRRCCEFVLHLHHSPEVIFERDQIETFLLPQIPKSLDPPSHTGAAWKVTLGSKEDVEATLDQKQWQYLGDHCIRLTRPDEKQIMEEQRKWSFIHNELQLDILSYFHVFQRCRLRRICSPWNDTLKTFWDQAVNRCLYFKFKLPEGDANEARFREKNINILRIVDQESESLCGHIPRLILHFDVKTDLPGALPQNAYLSRHQGRPKPLQFFDQFLLKHSHFSTVMLIGLQTSDFEIYTTLFKFGRSLRWPRPMKVMFHESFIQVEHVFPAATPDCIEDLGNNLIQYTPYPRFTEAKEGFLYSLKASNFSIQFDENSTEKERYIRLYKALDTQRAFWPYPPEQLHWLKTQLKNLPLDDDREKLVELNGKGEFSLRQAVRKCLKEDVTKRMVEQWESTGVFFEKTELNYRDCFLLSVLFAQENLLGNITPPPYKIDVKLNTTLETAREVILERAELTVGLNKFTRKLAVLHPFESNHCYFSEDMIRVIDDAPAVDGEMDVQEQDSDEDDYDIPSGDDSSFDEEEVDDSMNSDEGSAENGHVI